VAFGHATAEASFVNDVRANGKHGDGFRCPSGTSFQDSYGLSGRSVVVRSMSLGRGWPAGDDGPVDLGFR
jgi:hypothetical protein